jgi:hypothetical protein
MCKIHIYLENSVCKKLMYVEVFSSVKVMKLLICILLYLLLNIFTLLTLSLFGIAFEKEFLSQKKLLGKSFVKLLSYFGNF